MDQIKAELDGETMTAVRGNDPGHDGWIVTRGDGEDAVRTFYPDAGGAFRLKPDGTLGRQTIGTGAFRIPRSADAVRGWMLSVLASSA